MQTKAWKDILLPHWSNEPKGHYILVNCPLHGINMKDNFTGQHIYWNAGHEVNHTATGNTTRIQKPGRGHGGVRWVGCGVEWIPYLLMMAPPMRAPQPRPNAWCSECRIICAVGRLSTGTACVMYEQPAAHTLAWVNPIHRRTFIINIDVTLSSQTCRPHCSTLYLLYLAY